MAPVQLEPTPSTPTLDPNATYGDFRDDLARQGWAVAPSVLSRDQCDGYISKMHSWLESFQLGYKHDNPSTWSSDNLPVNHKGGLYIQYGVAHEQFLWDLRTEPGIVKPFEKLWDTDKLIVGYDGCNISIPNVLKEGDPEGKAWPHVDQSPLRKHLHCVQGIINLSENGPEDGGLMILQGSRDSFTEFFDVFDKDKPAVGWTTDDKHDYTDEQIKWLESRPGAGWHKVCAHPGDLILWDSRLCHYGAPTKSNNARIAAYVCYKPASLITPELLALKIRLFQEMKTTAHDGTLPREIPVPTVPKRRGHHVDPAFLARPAPNKPPVLDLRAQRFAGLVAH